MKAEIIRIPLFLYLASLLAGCNLVATAAVQEPLTQPPAETAAVETSITPAIPTLENDMSTEPSLPIPAIPGIQSLIEKAKADMAQRLSIEASQINTKEAREVFWPDASLGCPQPGIAYTQIEIPGYLIVLEYNGDEFEYHANIHNYVLYCEDPLPPVAETPANGNP